MPALCKTFKKYSGQGNWNNLVQPLMTPCQAQKVPIKIQQRQDNSLLNFNFLAVSLLACTPRPTQKSPGDGKGEVEP